MQASEKQIYRRAIRDGLGQKKAAKIQIQVLRGVIGAGAVGLAWDDESQLLYLLASTDQFAAMDTTPVGLLNMAIRLTEALGTFVTPEQRSIGTTYWDGAASYRFSLPDTPYQMQGFARPASSGPR